MTDDDSIAALERSGDRYTVEQSPIRSRYRAFDEAGTVVLKGKQKLFRLKEEFPFVDADGEPAFTVTVGGVLDVAGDYTMTDDRIGEPVVGLDNQWTLFADHWKLRDPGTEALVAEIRSKRTLTMVLRHLPYVGLLSQLLPREYEITDPEGDHVGVIDGQFSFRDRYAIEIDDASDMPKEAVVGAATVIDAIEGN